ncbi:MAG TPA: thiamine phosphate synthase [Pyrinomonadaceae bacterium]|nr:thiamine phosphate synthase [Pyrinomonadaceae bacterium]
MPLNLTKQIIYLITSGQTTLQTTTQSESFSRLLKLVEAAVSAEIDLIQLREKNLSTKVLFDLTSRAAAIAGGSHSRLLVNDRADVAQAAGAAGVHLTSRSIPASVIRKTFGREFLIGVSTHSIEEVRVARAGEADFVVFGPVFETASKVEYGPPVGLVKLREVASSVPEFPVLALGGVSLDNVGDCFRAGASGVAAIRMFENVDELSGVVKRVREQFAGK